MGLSPTGGLPREQPFRRYTLRTFTLRKRRREVAKGAAGNGVEKATESAYAPFGHWKTLTFIAALRCDRIEAPFVLDGPINGQAFRLYVETQLAPTLRPGDVVVMDNLGSHKGKAARAAIRSRGAHLLFLPAYSPDLNPIEQVFAKLKHLMRKSQPRGVEAAWRTAGQILERFTPNECANSLVNAGYGSV